MSDKLPPKILMIEPDEILNTNQCNMIERYWFDVSRAGNSENAIRAAKIDPPNIAIISSRLQDTSATEMAVQLRKTKYCENISIIFLIEPEESKNNYLSSEKPFNEILSRNFTPNELLTTIRALLRKAKPVFQDKIISFNDIKMDLLTYKVYRGANQVHLGPTEFKILQLFVLKPKNIYSRREIIDFVWGVDKEIAKRTIDVHINRIRKLMKLETDRYSLIKTIRAAGYCLD